MLNFGAAWHLLIELDVKFSYLVPKIRSLALANQEIGSFLEVAYFAQQLTKVGFLLQQGSPFREAFGLVVAPPASLAALGHRFAKVISKIPGDCPSQLQSLL